uniref:Uncharacterized protein n=1 Tax=Arundo donax TaxID=35708 RepID=A0A0A9BIZ7_ARUDO
MLCRIFYLTWSGLLFGLYS